MVLSGLFGRHFWRGCVWEGCRCTVCGRIRSEGHEWSSNFFYESWVYCCRKCTRCGTSGTLSVHDWWDVGKGFTRHGCKCAKCGVEEHDWSSIWNGEVDSCGGRKYDGRFIAGVGWREWTPENCRRCGVPREFYSINEDLKPVDERVYHNNSGCPAGRDILPNDRRRYEGPGSWSARDGDLGHLSPTYRLCDACHDLNNADLENVYDFASDYSKERDPTYW